jgi:hypothetical protein
MVGLCTQHKARPHGLSLPVDSLPVDTWSQSVEVPVHQMLLLWQMKVLTSIFRGPGRMEMLQGSPNLAWDQLGPVSRSWLHASWASRRASTGTITRRREVPNCVLSVEQTAGLASLPRF